jgi:predicted transport protein
MHGLSVIDQIGISDPILKQLTSLITQDGIDNFWAQEIANKLVSYERNQAYQRTLFLQLQQPNRTETTVYEEMRKSFAPELDMMIDVLNDQRYLAGRIEKSDMNFVINMQQKMLKLTLRQRKRQDAEHAKLVGKSVRYLKRSSNQLIKSLKGLRSV